MTHLCLKLHRPVPHPRQRQQKNQGLRLMNGACISICLAAVCMILMPITAEAQSQKTDIRKNANQLGSDEIIDVVAGQTYRGSYNFDRLGVARNSFIESHTEDGRVQYSEGPVSSKGIWYVKDDALCYEYVRPDMTGGCFRVYQIQNCFYYYSTLAPHREDEFDQDYWVARSSLIGETPNCLPPVG